MLPLTQAGGGKAAPEEGNGVQTSRYTAQCARVPGGTCTNSLPLSLSRARSLGVSVCGVPRAAGQGFQSAEPSLYLSSSLRCGRGLPEPVGIQDLRASKDAKL